MLTAEYDREMDIAVHCRAAEEKGREEGHKKGREVGHEEVLKLFEQGLSINEIKERLQ